jgi:hypothetical protein
MNQSSARSAIARTFVFLFVTTTGLINREPAWLFSLIGKTGRSRGCEDDRSSVMPNGNGSNGFCNQNDGPTVAAVHGGTHELC